MEKGSWEKYKSSVWIGKESQLWKRDRSRGVAKSCGQKKMLEGREKGYILEQEDKEIFNLVVMQIRKEKAMKKYALSGALIIAVMLILVPVRSQAQMGPGPMMGPGMMGYGPGYGGGWYCPYCGQYMGPEGGYGMGPGMMGRGWGYGMGPGMMGRGMGPGMMGPGWGYGPGPTGPGMGGPGYGYGPQYQQPQKPLEQKDAKGMLENYLQASRNPNLKLGKMEDKGQYFEAEIVTKNGALVDKIQVDKNTGWMRSIY